MEKIKRDKIRDVYHMKNQLVMTLGVWIDGKTYWLKNEEEKFLVQEGISIKVTKESLHSEINYFNFLIMNHEQTPQKVKLLIMHHHKHPTKEHFSFISPTDKVIYHFADQMIYLVNGRPAGNGISECTIQPQWNVLSEVFWSSRDHGTLKYMPMLKGSAISIYALTHELDGGEMQKCNSWVISGNNKEELMQLNSSILKTY
jgi:hypothetical protein